MAAIEANAYPVTIKSVESWRQHLHSANLWGREELDTTAPSITNITPAAGTALSRETLITFDITDNGALGLCMVVAEYPKGPIELVHNGTKYMPGYIGTLELSPVRRYSFRRAGGWTQWKGAPKISIYATDRKGNEAS